ncbi:hypothetical protein [Agrobacterium fabrum]|uniref:hypothetical protein n=1 Tax=Agrobacterium fabrum TaxID=1176649 RepID=UPI001E418CAA|nr:hypothetical protein [Agrobacterium fabrum]
MLATITGQLTLTEILTHQIMDILDQHASDDKDAPTFGDLVRVAPAQRRRVLFLIGEIESRSANLYDLAKAEADESRSRLEKVAPSPELEKVIAGWRAAHAEWRNRLEIGDESDSPESEAEDVAAEALLNFQCSTHEDVQRKLTLFAGVNHLASLGANYSDVFFPSLIIPEGGAA